MSMREKVCGNCEWWRRIPNVLDNTTGELRPAGRCQRFPPNFEVARGRSLFPTTLMDSFCGEWEVRTWVA